MVYGNVARLLHFMDCARATTINVHTKKLQSTGHYTDEVIGTFKSVKFHQKSNTAILEVNVADKLVVPRTGRIEKHDNTWIIILETE